MASITIIAAVYASNNTGKDVTAVCNQLVSQGNDDIPVNNTSFGDPDHGQRKYFTITFSVNNGPPQYMGAEEGTTLDLVP